MIRLTVLTLAVLVGIMVLWGDPGARRAPTFAAPAPELAETAEVTRITTPAPVVVEAKDQTPQRIRRYPGPDLKPSPEFAGQARVAQSDISPMDGADILYVTATRVNFRAGPSTNDAVIGALNGGSAVERLAPENAGWVNIRDRQGRVGYISGQFLSSEAPG